MKEEKRKRMPFITEMMALHQRSGSGTSGSSEVVWEFENSAELIWESIFFFIMKFLKLDGLLKYGKIQSFS